VASKVRDFIKMFKEWKIIIKVSGIKIMMAQLLMDVAPL
jgi:hypothetical protein